MRPWLWLYQPTLLACPASKSAVYFQGIRIRRSHSRRRSCGTATMPMRRGSWPSCDRLRQLHCSRSLAISRSARNTDSGTPSRLAPVLDVEGAVERAPKAINLDRTTEQPRPRLAAPYQHFHRMGGDGSHLLRRAPCSRPRAINTPSAKRTTTVKGTSSRSRRSTAASSTLCQTRIEFISCGRTDGGNQEFRPKRFNLSRTE